MGPLAKRPRMDVSICEGGGGCDLTEKTGLSNRQGTPRRAGFTGPASTSSEFR